MSGDSKPVSSSQAFCHRSLGRVVHKHLRAPHQRPVAAHTLAAFAAIRSRAAAHSDALIFDSFCGTGHSTALLAQQYPHSLVVGIDKSADRLARHQPMQVDNYVLVNADCGDFWRLSLEAGWRVQQHYLLYPNPWPKPGQLKRRLQGSPDLTALLALGGIVELRSNWQIYVEEFGVALLLAGNFPKVELLPEAAPLSRFEHKYRLSGHQLWRCQCLLGNNDTLGNQHAAQTR